MPPSAAAFLQRLDRTHNGVRGLLPAWRNLSKEDRKVTACAFLTNTILQMDVEALNVSPVIAANMLQPLPSDLVVRYLDAVESRRAQQEPQSRLDYDELEAEDLTAQRVAEFLGNDATAWSPVVFERLLATGLYGLLATEMPNAAFAAWWQSLDAGARKENASVALKTLNAPGFATAPYALREKTFTCLNEKVLGLLSPAARLEVMGLFVNAKLASVGEGGSGVDELAALNELTVMSSCAAVQALYPARHSWLEPLADPVKSGRLAMVLSASALGFSGEAARTSAQWGTAVGEQMNAIAQGDNADAYAVLLYAAIIQNASEKGLITDQQFKDCLEAFVGDDSSNLEKYLSPLDDLRGIGGAQWMVVLQFKARCKEVLLDQSLSPLIPSSPKPRF